MQEQEINEILGLKSYGFSAPEKSEAPDDRLTEQHLEECDGCQVCKPGSTVQGGCCQPARSNL